MVYTVKQLSRLDGDSVRTLHYYDEISILKPSSKGSNSYRYYSDEALIYLQQILFYRELDLSLDEIRRILENIEFDINSALESHKEGLRERIIRLERLIQTVDETFLQFEKKKRNDKQTTIQRIFRRRARRICTRSRKNV